MSNKHTVSSAIGRKRKTMTHDDDSDDNGGCDVDGMPVSVGEQPAVRTLAGPRGPVVDLSWRYLPPTFSLGKICNKGIFNILQLSSLSHVRYCDCMLFVNALDDFALLKIQFTEI